MHPHRPLPQRLARILVTVLFWIYLLLVIKVVFLPITVPAEWPQNITLQAAGWVLARVNLIPFRFGELFSASQGVILQELAGNILLTMPFGFLLPLIARVPAKRVPWIALGVGFAMELAQLAFLLLGIVANYGHSIDINDVLLNALGVLIGYGLYRGFDRVLLALLSRRDQEKGNRQEQVNAD